MTIRARNPDCIREILEDGDLDEEIVDSLYDIEDNRYFHIDINANKGFKTKEKAWQIKSITKKR